MSTEKTKKAKPFSFAGASFDDIINQDEKELSKKMSNDKKKTR